MRQIRADRFKLRFLLQQPGLTGLGNKEFLLIIKAMGAV